MENHQEDAEKKRLEAEKELQKLQGDEVVSQRASRMVWSWPVETWLQYP